MKKNSLIILIFFLSFFGYAQNDNLYQRDFLNLTWSYLSDRAPVLSEVEAGARGDKSEEPSSTDSILRNWLAPQTVYDHQPVARTFYFWTSFPDLDSSLEQNQLLRTSVSNDLDILKYKDNLLYHSRDNEPIVNHLMSGERQRVRSVWTSYWQNINYDTAFPRRQQLVQVVLMDSSLIVSYFPDKKKSERWRVHDLRGNLITMENAMQRKRHIAAVFVSGDDKIVFTGPRRTVYREQYRSFFLCNEDMIKSWHHGVPGLQAKVMKDFDYLILLNAWFENPAHCAAHGPKGKTCSAAWTKLSAQMSVTEMFFATCRRAGYLEPNADQQETKKILEALRVRFQGQMMPCERFPGRK